MQSDSNINYLAQFRNRSGMGADPCDVPLTWMVSLSSKKSSDFFYTFFWGERSSKKHKDQEEIKAQ